MNAFMSLSNCQWLVALGGVLLAPGVGLASEAKESPGALAPGPLPPSEGQRLDAPREESGGRKVGRIAAELGLMAATSLTVGVSGMLIGALNPSGDSRSTLDFPNFDGAGRGFLVGCAIGAPLGVWLGGRAARGQGSLEGVFLGAGAGGGLGLLASTLVPKKHGDVAPLLFPAFAMAGSLIGYEVSHALNMAPRPADDAVSLLPVLSMDARGSTLALSGRF
ncbi:hypothetical protein ACN469_19255 [Corallococcus terminator]